MELGHVELPRYLDINTGHMQPPHKKTSVISVACPSNIGGYVIHEETRPDVFLYVVSI